MSPASRSSLITCSINSSSEIEERYGVAVYIADPSIRLIWNCSRVQASKSWAWVAKMSAKLRIKSLTFVLSDNVRLSFSHAWFSKLWTFEVGYLPVCVRLEYRFLRRPCRILELSGSPRRVTCDTVPGEGEAQDERWLRTGSLVSGLSLYTRWSSIQPERWIGLRIRKNPVEALSTSLGERPGPNGVDPLTHLAVYNHWVELEQHCCPGHTGRPLPCPTSIPLRLQDTQRSAEQQTAPHWPQWRTP
jgi:hypothetical protein